MRCAVLSLPVLALFFLCGCLTLEQGLQFGRDQSVIVSYTYTFRDSHEEALRAAFEKLGDYVRAEDGGSTLRRGFFSESEVQDFFREQGLELRQYRKIRNGGSTTISITGLARNGLNALNSGIFGDYRLVKKDGRTRCEARLPRVTKNWSPEGRKRLENLCTGLELTLQITAPASIKRTNAGELGRKNTARWRLSLTGEPGQSLLEPPESLFVEW